MNLACGETYVGERVIRAQKDPVMLQDRRVMRNLLELEERYFIQTNYFECVQQDVQPYMRQIVATWMMQVCDEQQCEVDVFPLAMNYLDRFLSVQPIQRTQLQSLGSACMLLASKVKETLPLTTEKLVIYTDNSVQPRELLDFEMLLLMKLRWDVLAVTAIDFVDHIIHHLELDAASGAIARKQANTFIHLCCTDHKFSCYPSSLIASCAVGAAVVDLPTSPCDFHFTRSRLLSRLHLVTGIDADILSGCLDQVEATLKSNLLHVTSHPTNKLAEHNSDQSVQNYGADVGVGGMIDEVGGTRLVDKTPTDVDMVF